MRRKLIVRFLLAYVLITLCTQALSGNARVMLRAPGPPRFDASLSLWGMLQHSLTSLGRNLAYLLLPEMDMGAVAGVLVSASILLAGAGLFARGPVKDYHNLCEKVRRLSAETAWPQVEEKGEPDMERRLDAVAVRVAGTEDALQAHRADCQAAALLLDAACTQIEVLVEAGSFAEGSGEAGLVQDALSKIRKANSKIV
ncbi:MAG: hypothetical protein M1140_06085 [Chloroflexi bacterium]|nr:hypothetical protein [Chloroflexota bacterium]